MKVEIQRANPNLPLPQYATPGSAGMDLRANIKINQLLAAGATGMVPSGITIHMKSSSIAAMILPRSGLGYRHGIVMANTIGLIDSDYQGELQIPLWNRSDQNYIIAPYERIAQLVFVSVHQVELVEIDAAAQVPPTARGAGGFGSTGTIA